MKNLRTFSTDEKKLILIVLALLCIVSAAASICLGSVYVSLKDIADTLFFGKRGTPEAQIILYSRLPRTMGSIAAGVALAVSGAVIQSVLSNPLAAPNIIGVNSGAGVAVALGSAFLPTLYSVYPLIAFAGALLGVFIVVLIAEKTSAAKITLVLAGVAVSSIFNAVIDAIITIFPDALNGYADFKIGGLANLTTARVLPAVAVILPALVLLILMSNELDVLSLGTDTAKSLGLNAKRVRVAALCLAAALAGASVSFAGLLGFVGLIVPHIMRRLLGEESRPLVIGCALGGAFFLTLCDIIARVVFAPYEMPVGVVLSLVGGPFFIWLLFRQRGGRSHD